LATGLPQGSPVLFLASLDVDARPLISSSRSTGAAEYDTMNKEVHHEPTS
jgi:hypothetical protein